MGKLTEYLLESSLSRVYRHNEKYDCGTITAFRGDNSFDDNIRRNKSLVNKLLRKRYSITKVSGRFVEDGNKPVIEKSFFVVDIEDKGTLEQDLIQLGKEFDQEAILFLPKGTVDGLDKAYFVDCSSGKKTYFGGSGKFGSSDNVYLSYVNGRPFYMDKMEEIFNPPQTNNGRYLIYEYSNRVWPSLKIDEDDIKKFG